MTAQGHYYMNIFRTNTAVTFSAHFGKRVYVVQVCFLTYSVLLDRSKLLKEYLKFVNRNHFVGVRLFCVGSRLGRTQKKTNRQNRRGWWARNLTRKFDKISLTNRFFCAAGENFRGFGDRFTLKTRFRMHPRMCFLRKIFPNSPKISACGGHGPSRKHN